MHRVRCAASLCIHKAFHFAVFHEKYHARKEKTNRPFPNKASFHKMLLIVIACRTYTMYAITYMYLHVTCVTNTFVIRNSNICITYERHFQSEVRICHVSMLRSTFTFTFFETIIFRTLHRNNRYFHTTVE